MRGAGTSSHGPRAGCARVPDRPPTGSAVSPRSAARTLPRGGRPARGRSPSPPGPTSDCAFFSAAAPSFSAVKIRACCLVSSIPDSCGRVFFAARRFPYDAMLSLVPLAPWCCGVAAAGGAEPRARAVPPTSCGHRRRQRHIQGHTSSKGVQGAAPQRGPTRSSTFSRCAERVSSWRCASFFRCRARRARSCPRQGGAPSVFGPSGPRRSSDQPQRLVAVCHPTGCRPRAAKKCALQTKGRRSPLGPPARLFVRRHQLPRHGHLMLHALLQLRRFSAVVWGRRFRAGHAAGAPLPLQGRAAVAPQPALPPR